MRSKASKLTWLFAPLLGFQRWTTLPGLLLTLALLACTVIALPVAEAVGPNAVRPGFNANSLAGNDDGSTGLVPIGISINFFGTTYTDLFVNNNGNITLDAALGNFTPFDLASTSREIIAPFFADVDTGGGNVVTYGQGTVDGRPAFGVTWPAVGCFSQTTSVLNIFQVILTDRSDTGVANFDIEFNYDQIQWETGQASGGSSQCLGGNSVRVGYSNGTGAAGTFFELPGSAVNGAFLDTNLVTGLIYNSLNSGGQLGRYVFSVRAGLPATGFIDLTPNTDTSLVGENHTVTATVRAFDLSPLAGAQVDFEVVSGPNVGTAGSAVADASGQASFTYTGVGGAGTDIIEASFFDSTGAIRTATNQKEWRVAVPPPPPPPPPPNAAALSQNPQLGCTGSACRVAIKCDAVPGTSCNIAVKVLVPKSALRHSDDPAAKARGRLLFASGATNIPAGQIAKVKLGLRKTGKQIVRSSKRKRIRGVMEIRNSTGAVSSTRIRVKLPRS